MTRLNRLARRLENRLPSWLWLIRERTEKVSELSEAAWQTQHDSGLRLASSVNLSDITGDGNISITKAGVARQLELPIHEDVLTERNVPATGLPISSSNKSAPQSTSSSLTSNSATRNNSDSGRETAASNHQKADIQRADIVVDVCNSPASLRDRARRGTQSTMLFALAVIGFTGLIGQSLYDQPVLDVGKQAPKTLYAPRDATVIDEKLTQEERRKAALAAIPVLQIDLEKSDFQRNGLVRAFRHGNELRARLGPFPVVNPSIISSDVQQYLRRLSVSEWERVRREAKADQSRPAGNAGPLGRKAVRQLRAVAETRSGSEMLAIEQQLLAMRQQYLQAKSLLQDEDLTELNAAYSVEVFELSERNWEQLKTSASVALERILVQGITPGLPPENVDTIIALHLELAIPQDDLSVAEELRSVAAPILRHVLEPNLIQDPIATQLQVEQAASKVKPVPFSIREGDAIVEAGQEITTAQLTLLDEFGLSERGPNWIGLLFLGGIIWVEVSLLWLLQRRLGPRFRRRDWLVVGMVAATAPLIFALPGSFSSLPAVGLLIGSFYGSPMGVAVVGSLAIALPVGLELEMQALIASAASGIVGALVSGRLRSREELALLGLGVGLTQCLVHLLISLILSGATGLLWVIFLRNALSHALRGIAWSIVALGISPYLERLFDLITPIRMAELSNPNRPLLQRLAKETPGTFQHTLFVSTLAEAAARALGCNVELIRAGTLYHDIGKMHDPQGFIENQMGGPNKHDLLNDPWQSAAIIKKHVTEGQVMARRSSLPRALRNFIPEHQGTMRISYFYQQALKLAAEDPEHYSVNEADFRYDGPIPQSRETGIVMLADSCEAALRSLKDATSEEALNMVKKIIRARWKDNQLCDADLSKADLELIAAVFVQIWQQFHHKRIPYPSTPRPPILSPS